MKNLKFLIIGLFLIGIIGCENDNPAVVVTEDSSISGQILLIDENGDTLTTDGTIVSFTGNSIYRDTTNSTGNFNLTNVDADVYSISYLKEGWPEYTQTNFQFVGKGNLNLGTIYLSKTRVGNLQGNIELIDTYGNSVNDRSGVQVTLTNSENTYTDTTTTSGNYEIQGAEAGVYTISFEKEGWKSVEENNFQFSGNGTITRDQILYPPNKQSPLVGVAELSNQYNETIFDKSDIVISITNTNLSAVTNTKGMWKIENMTNGSYSIIAVKEGFDFLPGNDGKYFEHDTVNGNEVQINEPELIERPTVEIILKEPVYNHRGGDTGEVFFSRQYLNKDPQKLLYDMWFFSTTEDVSSVNYLVKSDGYIKELRFPEDPFSRKLRETFPSGTRVYARAYMVHEKGGVFTNSQINEKMAIGFGSPSNVISFIIP